MTESKLLSLVQKTLLFKFTVLSVLLVAIVLVHPTTSLAQHLAHRICQIMSQHGEPCPPA